jgi:NitT/TauT family transport system ATP-binding protein
MVAVPAAKTAVSQPNGIGVALEHLSHQFTLPSGPLPVLDDIDLKIEPGAFVALLGPSGSGKSTILRIVAGLEAPTHGAVVVDGNPVAGPHPSRALVFQDPTLFPWRTVWRNVGIGPEALGTLTRDDPRVQEALERVGLAGFARAYPHQLSGGMAQRVALARALVNEPALFLLDEPLGKLDALTRGVLQKELLRLWEASRFTALLVTHDVDEALTLSDRLIVLSERPGRIFGDLTVDIARPRRHEDPRFQELRRVVLGLLGFDE